MTRTQSDPLTALDVSRETIARLENFLSLVAKWNPAINLVARSTLENAWARHIQDSAQLYALMPPGTRHWADLGSGGGFPGLVIAILALERDPELRVTLVEADQRKSAFLRQASHTMALGATVIAERIESLAPLGADLLSARALAPLTALCGFTQQHRTSAGVSLFPKGANHALEVAAARTSWQMDLESVPSATDAEAVILKLKGLSHV